MSRMNFFTGALPCAGLTAILLAGGQQAIAHDNGGNGKAQKTEIMPYTQQSIGPSSAYDEAAPPLWDNLGSLTFPVTTRSEQAQRYFDQGLRLAYAFNHAEARRAFRQAQQLDPNCALCYWGEALVLGPNINVPMAPAANAPALAALRRAQVAAGGATAKERALIEALAMRYSDDPAADRAALDAAYADAMGRVAARYPDDEDISVLYAESLMDMSPWDYWEAGGSRPKGRTAELVATLERVLARNPDHPGAIHLYIHTVEASDRPERAEPYADRLGRLMPGAGHLVHMPSHIYYRVGRYIDSLETNKVAVAADEAYLAQAKPTGPYPVGYYPHNIHFLLASAQMAGDGKTAIAAAEKLQATVTDEAARSVPWLVQPIKAAPYFAHARFSPAETVLTLPAPADDLPYLKAMWHYARGVAQATAGDVAAARTEVDAMARLGRNADFSALTAGGVPANKVVELAGRVVLARIAQARGDLETAIDELETAVALQDELAYMEPPYWYFPVRQSLGAALLLAGRPQEGEAVFLASLERVPNNGWAMFGLMQAQKARGDLAAAKATKAKLAGAWAGDRSLLKLERL